MFLLEYNLAHKIYLNIGDDKSLLQCIPYGPNQDAWWLCTPNVESTYQVAFVLCANGLVGQGNQNHQIYHAQGVRSALKLKRSAVNFDADSKTFSVKEPIPTTVTFKVEHGKWNEGTGEPKTVTLYGYEGDTLALEEGQIPAVGELPDEGYEAGSWSPDPKQTEITENTEFTTPT